MGEDRAAAERAGAEFAAALEPADRPALGEQRGDLRGKRLRAGDLPVAGRIGQGRADRRGAIGAAETGAAVVRHLLAAEQFDPAMIGAAERDAVVARGGFHIELPDHAVVEQPGIGDGVERDAAGIAGVACGEAGEPILEQRGDRRLHLALRPEGDVGIILEVGPKGVMAGGGAIERCLPSIGDEDAAFAHREGSGIHRAGPAIRGQAHQLADIVQVAEDIMAHRRIEAADRMAGGVHAEAIGGAVERAEILDERRHAAAVEAIEAVLLAPHRRIGAGKVTGQDGAGKVGALRKRAAAAVHHQDGAAVERAGAGGAPGMGEMVGDGGDRRMGIVREQAGPLEARPGRHVEIGGLDDEGDVREADPLGIQAIADRIAVVAAVMLAAGEAFLLDPHRDLAVPQQHCRAIVRQPRAEDVNRFSHPCPYPLPAASEADRIGCGKRGSCRREAFQASWNCNAASRA